jgi:hypothetical protein
MANDTVPENPWMLETMTVGETLVPRITGTLFALNETSNLGHGQTLTET